MLSRNELTEALKGIKGLLSMQVAAFGHFDATPAGFWRSFWAAALILPAWALIEAQQMLAIPPGAPVRYALLHGIAYVISWLAYPLLMVRISGLLDRWPRYFTYMVAYNWFQLIQTLAWLPLLLLVALNAPRELILLLWLTTHGVLFAYSWFIARRGLDVQGSTAAALVVIDFLLGLLIDGVTDAIH